MTTVFRLLRHPTWWRHQMETFSALLAICAGNLTVPGAFPYKGQWRGALMLSLTCAWRKGWVNNRDAADLGRYRAHYDVTIMKGYYYMILIENQQYINRKCASNCSETASLSNIRYKSNFSICQSGVQMSSMTSIRSKKSVSVTLNYWEGK